MNLKIAAQLFSLTLLLSSCEQCSTVTQVEPNRAAWDVKGEHYSTTVATLEDSVLTSTCQDNNIMFVRLGNKNPLASDGEKAVRIVDYNKKKLELDEITIDIAHGYSLDFLSSGQTEAVINGVTYLPSATLKRMDGKVTVSFKNVPMRGYGSMGPLADTMLATGFIMER